MEIHVNEVTVEIEDKLLEQAKALLEPEGMTVEELLRQFIRWCAENPDLAEETLRRWQKEEQKAEKTKTNNMDKEDISHG
ncbi:MAG: hypothetical protein J6J87_11230 [Oscillospiraceae bacterium]|nr:hypothetical protein [Oscillospiraceae bacterium]